MAETRYNHYVKRRNQALTILQVRHEDKRNNENEVPVKRRYYNAPDIC